MDLWISVLNSYGIGAALGLAAVLLGPGIGGRRGVTDTVPLSKSRVVRGREQVDLAFELGVRAMIDGMRAVLANQSS